MRAEDMAAASELPCQGGAARPLTRRLLCYLSSTVGDVGHGARNPDDVRIEALSWDCIVRLAWLDGVCPREVVSGCHLVGPPRLP